MCAVSHVLRRMARPGSPNASMRYGTGWLSKQLHRYARISGVMLCATLVMPVFNEIENLGDVLSSIDAQDVAADRLFCVIVDNGSDDGSREMAQHWLAAGAI